jgi:opacity protein-like surface antigen
MSRLSVLVCALAALSPIATAVAEDCVEPAEPEAPPKGETATRNEMRAAQEAMKLYNTAVTEFSACVERNHLNAAAANGAVRKLQTLANRFNAELRTFKQRDTG